MKAANENFEGEVSFAPLETQQDVQRRIEEQMSRKDIPWQELRQKRPPYEQPLNHRADSYGVFVAFDGSYFDDWYAIRTKDGREYDLALALPFTFRTLRHDDTGRTLDRFTDGGHEPIEIPHEDVAEIALVPNSVLERLVPTMRTRERESANRIMRAQWLLPEEQEDIRPARVLAKQIKLSARGGSTIALSIDAQARNRPLQPVEGSMDFELPRATYSVVLDSATVSGPINRLLKQQGASVRLRFSVGFRVTPTDVTSMQAVEMESVEVLRAGRRPIDWFRHYTRDEVALIATLYFTRYKK